MKKILANTLNKYKEFYHDHEFAFKAGAIAVGAWVFYSKSFDYGYDCRVNIEKACDAETGSNIVDILKAYGE